MTMIRKLFVLGIALLPGCSNLPHTSIPVSRASAGSPDSETLKWIQLWQQMQGQNSLALTETLNCKAARTLMMEANFPLRAFAKSKFEIECQGINKGDDQDDGLWRLDVLSYFALKTPTLTDDVAYFELQYRLSPNPQEQEDALLKLIYLSRQLQQEQQAKEWEEKLGQISPRLQPGVEENLKRKPLLRSLPRITPSQWLIIAKDFREHLDYKKAIQSYQKALADKELSLESGWELYKQLRQTYKLSSHKKIQMLSTSRKWSLWTETALRKNPTQLWVDLYFETQLTHARGLWTEKRQQESLRVLNQTKALLTSLAPRTDQGRPLQFSLAEIDFIFARIQEQDHHYDRAVAAYDSALLKQPESKLQEKILWAKAWLLYRREKYSEAASALKDLVQTFKNNNKNENPSSPQIPPLPDNQPQKNQSQKWRALYWQARANEKIKPGAGRELYQELIQDDPLGYYGLMAQRDLGHPLPPLPSLPKDKANEGESVSSNSLPKTVSLDAQSLNFSLLRKAGVPIELLSGLDWGLRLQEKTLIKIFIARIERALGPTSAQSSETQLEFLKAQAIAGLYLPLFTKLSTLETPDRLKLLSQSPQLLFPQIRPDLVAEITRDYHYSPSLVYAITRQESAFDPQARSGADALGLMQLLPSIAKPSALALGLPVNNPLLLFDPEYNLRVGAKELHRLLDSWKNQYIPAIASYNAGEKVVRAWMKKKFRQDPLEFIEEIPYEETRNYVKLVLRNYTFYERLRSLEPIFLDENLLKLKGPR
jgi:soluble lytic murein transglycosylase